MRIDLQELSAALAASDTVAGVTMADPVEALIVETLEARLNAAGLAFSDGALLFERQYQDREIEGGCNNTVVRSLLTQVTLDRDTAVEFTLQSLSEPVSIRLQLEAQIDAMGRARQVFGFRLGRCRTVAVDNFDLSARGTVAADVSVALSLNPEWVAADTLQLRPALQVEGSFSLGRVSVDVDDSLLAGLLEDFLQSELSDAFRPSLIDEQLSALQQSLQDSLYAGDAQLIELRLPEPDDEQIALLYQLLAGQSRLPLTVEYVRRNRFAILVALVTGDQQALAALAGNAVGCQVASTLQTELSPAPAFVLDQRGCRRVDPRFETAPQLFSDAACTRTLPFHQTSFGDYCDTLLDSEQLGNAAADAHRLGSWSVSPGNTLALSALPPGTSLQPYVQRRQYKSVAVEAASCQLEMRIYTPRPDVSGRRAVLALHGGSWQFRPTGFVGMEVMATHLTQAGYVVFAPFYRLLGTRDGPAACHNASLAELLADTSDALNWVLDNGASYGVTGKPAVFGQSAGAHLATSLAVNRAADISRAAVFYGPLDFADLLLEIQSSPSESSQAQDTLEVVAGAALEALTPTTPLVAQNSFPAIIAAGAANYPPFFLLHGEQDDIVPFSQSVRLCNALSGDIASGPAPLTINLDDTLRRVVACDDRGSELHLIAEGDHALDICVAQPVCAAGSPDSAQQVAESLRQMIDWIGQPVAAIAASDESLPQSDAAGRLVPASTAAGGVFNLALIAWLLPIACLRRWLRRANLRKR